LTVIGIDIKKYRTELAYAGLADDCIIDQDLQYGSLCEVDRISFDSETSSALVVDAILGESRRRNSVYRSP